MSLIDIPGNVFLIINEFCSVNKLLETRRFLYQVKRRVGIYKLNRTYSLEYYNDATFRELVLQTINNSSKQLYLDLHGCR